MTHLVIRLIILSYYYKTRFAARKETQRDETVSWNKCETRQIGQHYFVSQTWRKVFFSKKLTPWIVDKNHMFLENNSLFIYY